MGKGSSSHCKLGQCIKVPVRVLRRARDLYVNCLTGCAGSVRNSGVASAMSHRGGSFDFRQSTSTASDEDIRDLIRIASRATVHPSGGAGRARSQKDGAVVPRSSSVATIGRIDEHRPCTFEEEEEEDEEYPRSRSCAVAAKKRVGALD